MTDKTRHPKVSIICITYNHEDYLAQALDSFLMQRTRFPIEILVHDDASTDGTREIIRDYTRKYPKIIKPTYEKMNQYSQGKMDFINSMYERAQGVYIAACEGDDYWTDPNKLQLQVDFMDKHTDHAICFHPVRVFFEDHRYKDTVYPLDKDSKIFTLKELLKRNFIQSNSVMYRKQNYNTLSSNLMPFDWYAHLFHAQFGKIGFINNIMSAYRRHEGGIWWDAALGNLDDIWRKSGIQHLKFYNEIRKLYGGNAQYEAIIDEHIEQLYTAIVRTDGMYKQNQLAQAIRQFPDATALYIKRAHSHGEQAATAFKQHADEQAKIIEHYVSVTSRLEQRVKHPLRAVIKSKLHK